ncbi:MAG: hypothetical protein AAFR87_22415 [Bacteroidota bacterium]
MFGGNFLNFDQLNQNLVANEYASLPSSLLSVGLGLYKERGRFIYGGELYNYMISESDLANQDASIAYHYALFRTGWVVYRQENSLLVYPNIGVGGGLGILKTRPNTEPLPERFNSSGLMFDAAITLSKFKPLDLDGKYQLELGVSLGYMRTLNNMWNITGLTQTDDSISVNPDGFYFKLSLGMGSLR